MSEQFDIDFAIFPNFKKVWEISYNKLNDFPIKMNQAELKQVYEMVDSIQFSRPKKNISRDFSDGVMMA